MPATTAVAPDARHCRRHAANCSSDCATCCGSPLHIPARSAPRYRQTGCAADVRHWRQNDAVPPTMCWQCAAATIETQRSGPARRLGRGGAAVSGCRSLNAIQYRLQPPLAMPAIADAEPDHACGRRNPTILTRRQHAPRIWRASILAFDQRFGALHRRRAPRNPATPWKSAPARRRCWHRATELAPSAAGKEPVPAARRRTDQQLPAPMSSRPVINPVVLVDCQHAHRCRRQFDPHRAILHPHLAGQPASVRYRTRRGRKRIGIFQRQPADNRAIQRQQQQHRHQQPAQQLIAQRTHFRLHRRPQTNVARARCGSPHCPVQACAVAGVCTLRHGDTDFARPAGQSYRGCAPC